jgi:carbamoyltransferase
LSQEFGHALRDEKLFFVPHHLAHAISAYTHSGFSKAIVLTLDGYGDGLSGAVMVARGLDAAVLRTWPATNSLGFLYDEVIAILGYKFTEEYKVMGLAPYGDPGRFRDTFRSIYDLEPNGDYRINWTNIERLYALAPNRKSGEPLTKEHMDLAAGLQEMLEAIVLHILRYFREFTGAERLCVAGGVAHNCSANGKILYAGLFSDIFVHPASHDAGCAVGAALYPFLKSQGLRVGDMGILIRSEGQQDAVTVQPNPRLEHVYWGSEWGRTEELDDLLRSWESFLDYEIVPDICKQTAALLADNAVVGWVQGRSEFGPRALGNRSILADPRPAENKDRINQMVKKREAYRPFAPAIMDQYAEEFFDLPYSQLRFPFMSFAVKVRPDKRELLRATTHVDGTARVQTVSESTNPRFHQLIDAFRQLTGIPVLLNTSFNNNSEPIVDSAEDAITCFLTTELDYLVIGNYLIRRLPFDLSQYSKLIPILRPYIKLRYSRGFTSPSQMAVLYELSSTYDSTPIPISERVFHILSQLDPMNTATLEQILSYLGISEDERAELLQQFAALWVRRMVTLHPKHRAKTYPRTAEPAVVASPIAAEGEA